MLWNARSNSTIKPLLMNSRRTFLLSLPLAAAGTASATVIEASPQFPLDGPDSAKTVEELKKDVLFATYWKEATFEKRKFVFGVTSQGDGESYIDLHGWIYNQHFKEWRRILKVKTRNLGNSKLLVDEAKGVLSLLGAANNDLDKAEVFRFDLRATSDDAGYVK